jgi:hypothetical protein
LLYACAFTFLSILVYIILEEGRKIIISVLVLSAVFIGGMILLVVALLFLSLVLVLVLWLKKHGARAEGEGEGEA